MIEFNLLICIDNVIYVDNWGNETASSITRLKYHRACIIAGFVRFDLRLMGKFCRDAYKKAVHGMERT